MLWYNFKKIYNCVQEKKSFWFAIIFLSMEKNYRQVGFCVLVKKFLYKKTNQFVLQNQQKNYSLFWPTKNNWCMIFFCKKQNRNVFDIAIIRRFTDYCLIFSFHWIQTKKTFFEFRSRKNPSLLLQKNYFSFWPTKSNSHVPKTNPSFKIKSVVNIWKIILNQN